MIVINVAVVINKNCINDNDSIDHHYHQINVNDSNSNKQ